MLYLNAMFPVVDSKLRAGVHIDQSDLIYWSFVSDNYEELSAFFGNYKCDLVVTPEQVFYLRPKAQSLIARTTLTSLEMMVGRLLCYLHLNLHLFDKSLSGWMSFDVLVVEFKVVVTNEKIAEIYKSKESFTDADLARLIERLKTVLRRFKKWGFVQLSENDGMSFHISSAILRFAADAAGQDDPQLIQRLLVNEGELSSLDEGVGEYSPVEDEELSTEVQLDLLGNSYG